MNTRLVLEKLGFQQEWDQITDQQPSYVYDFGNLQLTAAQVVSRYFQPILLFGGVVKNVRSLRLVQFEMPLEVESFEQGVAWLTHGIGQDRLSVPAPWLDDGRAWRDQLPWVRKQNAYNARPKCSVEKEWFRVAAKKLRKMALLAAESDLASLDFDGEALRITVGSSTLIMQATGKPWSTRYAIKVASLENLPKQLSESVEIGIWDGTLKIGNRALGLVQRDNENVREAGAK